MDVFVYRSSSYDSFLNMALENALFQSIRDGQIFLFLYQNQKSVIIGRNQNPWQQAFITMMERDKVFLCRRSSGGGAVYQDKGNLNFCFIRKNGFFDKKKNLEFILSALKKLHISAQANCRYDLMLRHGKEDFKFSGSAFRQAQNRSLHHGTLLINSDLDKLKYYLNPPKRQWHGHTVSSTPAKVINLKSLNPQISIDAVVDVMASSFFCHHKKKGTVEILNDSRWQSKEFENYHNKIRSFKWCLGGGPPFTQIIKKKWNNSYLKCLLEIRDGMVKRVQFSGKGYICDKVEQLLKGRFYCPDEIEQLLDRHLTF